MQHLKIGYNKDNNGHGTPGIFAQNKDNNGHVTPGKLALIKTIMDIGHQANWL